MFSCEYYKIFKNRFFYRTPPVAVFETLSMSYIAVLDCYQFSFRLIWLMLNLNDGFWNLWPLKILKTNWFQKFTGPWMKMSLWTKDKNWRCIRHSEERPGCLLNALHRFNVLVVSRRSEFISFCQNLLSIKFHNSIFFAEHCVTYCNFT